METAKSKVKCKRPSDAELSKERKMLKFPTRSAPVQKSTEIEKRASNEMQEEKEQQAGFEGRIRKDSSFDSQEELLSAKLVQDGQPSETETNKISSHEVAQRERDDPFAAQVAKLNQERSMLASKMQRLSKKCMRLTRENRRLMDELKTICEPHVIDILVAKDPVTDCAVKVQDTELSGPKLVST